MAVRLLDQSTAPTTVNNTTAETVLTSMTAPANTLSNGGGMRMSVAGTITNSTATGGTVVLRAKAAVSGSTTTILESSGIAVSTSTKGRTWAAEVVMFGQQPSVQHNWGGLVVSSPSTMTLPPSSFEAVGRSTGGLDETVQITMSMWAQMSTTSTGFTVTRQAALLEGLGA
jgi:hypothetical protein